MVKKIVKNLRRFSLLLLPILLTVASCADMQKAKDANTIGNYTVAHKNLTILAEKGFPKAKIMLAKMYLDGIGVPANPTKALHLLKQADAEGQYTGAVLTIGKIYKNGLGVPVDVIIAERYFKRALALGNVKAYIQLGDVEIMMGNFAMAEANYKKGITAGVPKGALKIGEMYRKGLGRPVDNMKALYWFFLARKKGVPNMDVKILNTQKKLDPDDLARALKLSDSFKYDGNIK